MHRPIGFSVSPREDRNHLSSAWQMGGARYSDSAHSSYPYPGTGFAIPISVHSEKSSVSLVAQSALRNRSKNFSFGQISCNCHFKRLFLLLCERLQHSCHQQFADPPDHTLRA